MSLAIQTFQTAVLGGALLSTLGYASACKELIDSSSNKADSTDPFIYETFGMSCVERVKAARANLDLCPDARDFFNKVMEEGEVKLKCVTQKQAPRGAATDITNRVIMFAKADSPKEPVSKRIRGEKSPTSLLLYELGNMYQQRKIQNLNDIALIGLLSETEFVYEIESLELETSQMHHRIAKKCIESGWNPEIAQQTNFGKDSPVQFSKEERREWFKTSPYAKYIKSTDADSDLKIRYLMLNEKIGHTDLVLKRLKARKASYQNEL